ncbi:MAG: NAD(P)-binding protein, partial [Candidatus Poribacteria bacterium]
MLKKEKPETATEQEPFLNANKPLPSKAGDKVGSVLVVGGGIAGMQASMDLADSGFKVYLADKKPAIGGHMAQLDKTFPTNDCAMCIISPRLIDMSENDNVELITCAQLEKLEGEPGNFTAHFRQFPRYVDEEKCNNCGKCLEVCTVDVKDEFNLGVGDRKAIYRLFPQAVPATVAIDKLQIPRCRAACPIHTNVQGYVSLIANGKFAEAYQVNKEVNPFPSICGRVCHHPCESACLRNR